MTRSLGCIYFSFSLLFCTIFAALITPSSPAVHDEPIPFDFSKYPECNETGGKSPSPAVPKLSEAFSLKMEVKMDANHYMDSEGYYEKEGQRGASFVMAGGIPSAYLFDFISGKAFSILGVDRRTCQAEDLWETGCNTYAYFIAELAGHSKILGNCNLTAGNVTYFGPLNSTIRAIKVDMWQQCVRDHRSNTTSLNKYYFTTAGVIPPSGSSPSPIRFETKNIDGPKAQQMSVYDFTYYLPEVKDDSVFLPERGVYCPGWARANNTMPTLPDKFSLSMTTLAKKEKDVYNLQLNFDYKHGMVAFVTDTLNGTRFPPIRSKNRTLTRTIHDYNSGLTFTMPMSTWLMGGKECFVRAIDNTTLESASNNSGEVHMKHAWELFGLGATNWVYVGKRDFNGMPAYVWNSQRNNTKKPATVMVTTEVYWLHENWTTTGSPVLIGLIIYRNFENGTVIETYQSTISDFNTNSPSFNNWRAFDVEVCLKNGNEKVITFCIKVQNYTEIASLPSFETGLRDTLANMSGTSPLQYTDLQLTKGDAENEAHVWVTVLDWVNKTWNVNPSRSSTADQVVQTLRNQFGQKDYSTQIYYANRSQPATFLKNTIQTGSDLLRPTSPKPVTSTLNPIAPGTPASLIQEGYTSGSMAGLAIAMIIIGGVAGLVAGFLLWKRNTGIAYQVYD